MGFLHAFTLCAALGGASATQPLAQVLEPATPVRSISLVKQDLYRVREGDLLAVFLVTPEGIIVVDPLNRPAATWLKGELATRFPGRPVRYVIQSHHHLDRIGGAGVFKATAELVGHQDFNHELEKASHILPPFAVGWDANHNGKLERSEVPSDSFGATLLVRDLNHDDVLTPLELYSDAEYVESSYTSRRTINLGGKTVELIHPGKAHAGDMTALYFPAERVVFSAGNPDVTSRPFSFGTDTTSDVMDWVHSIARLDFDTLLFGQGSEMARSDLVRLGQYLDELVAGVSKGVADGRSLGDLEASSMLDTYRGGPHYAERNAHIAHVYGGFRRMWTDFYGFGAFSRISRNSTYCSSYETCVSGGIVPAGTAGMRISIGRLAGAAELTFSGQTTSFRSTALYDDAFAHRDTAGSFLFRYDVISQSRSFALLGGLSVRFGDTLGVHRDKEGLAPFAGRHVIAATSTAAGLTVGADIMTPMGNRVSLFVPIRLTTTLGEPIDTQTGQLEVQIGVGLNIGVLRRVK